MTSDDAMNAAYTEMQEILKKDSDVNAAKIDAEFNKLKTLLSEWLDVRFEDQRQRLEERFKTQRAELQEDLNAHMNRVTEAVGSRESLLDKFAGQALIARAKDFFRSNPESSSDSIAQDCYCIADAMIKEGIRLQTPMTAIELEAALREESI